MLTGTALDTARTLGYGWAFSQFPVTLRCLPGASHVSDTRIHFDDEDWSQLECVLEAFTAAWDEGQAPPTVPEFLDGCSPALREKLAVELIKVDLENRWQRGLRRLIEDYRPDFPDLDRIVTAPLIFEEYHTRRQAEDDVIPSEYFRRFPEHAADLDRLFRVDPLLRSTILADAASPQMQMLSAGESIDDFDLLLKLGEGAFATVFLARQRSMQRLVAVKISADQGTEPQTLAQLDHNNIIRVYDQRSFPDRGLRLLYMQYAAGGTLAGVIAHMRKLPVHQWNGREFLKAIDDVLDGHGETPPSESAVRARVAQMSWSQVVGWMGAQLAQALHVAHKQGVLHRDLKPANVLLTAEGVPKLADFNISFSADLAGSSPAAMLGGSLAYMSPEQLEACNPAHPRQADSLDGRSDQFSLGILLWELLSGQRPFDDSSNHCGWETRLVALARVRQRGPVPARVDRVVHTNSDAIVAVLLRCIAARVEDRFASTLEAARLFELSLQPDAQRLLADPNTGWRRWARRFPLSTISVITVIPNVIAAVFNFIYNHSEISNRLPEAEPTFMQIKTIVNMVAFPTGIVCASWLAGSVGKAIRLNQRKELSAVELQERRRRCLDLGNLSAIVGVTLWLIAGPVYPISLHLMLGGIPTTVYAHFVSSLALCGLIAAAYPFFGVTFVAIRCFYPRLIRLESTTAEDIQALQRLMRLSWFYLGLAASVPMIAVLILVLSGSNSRFELVTLAAGGVLGFGIALSAFRLVQADLATLIRLLSRND